MRRHSQTPRTDTKRLHKLNFLSFISQQTLRQHKLPDPCHHLICSTILKSEARTCQLLIAAEEKTSNPTQRYSLSFCLSCLLLTTFSVFQKLLPLLLISFPPVPGFLPKLSSSSHSSPRSLPPITHQWGAAYPHRSAAILPNSLPEHKHPSIPCKQNLPLH